MFKVILIILAIVVISSFFRRYLLLFVMRYISRKLFKQFQNQPGFQNRTEHKPQGSVTIDTKVNNKSNRKDNNNGDYVDYEEIK